MEMARQSSRSLIPNEHIKHKEEFVKTLDDVDGGYIGPVETDIDDCDENDGYEEIEICLKSNASYKFRKGLMRQTSLDFTTPRPRLLSLAMVKMNSNGIDGGNDDVFVTEQTRTEGLAKKSSRAESITRKTSVACIPNNEVLKIYSQYHHSTPGIIERTSLDCILDNTVLKTHHRPNENTPATSKKSSRDCMPDNKFLRSHHRHNHSAPEMIKKTSLDCIPDNAILKTHHRPNYSAPEAIRKVSILQMKQNRSNSLVCERIPSSGKQNYIPENVILGKRHSMYSTNIESRIYSKRLSLALAVPPLNKKQSWIPRRRSSMGVQRKISNVIPCRQSVLNGISLNKISERALQRRTTFAFIPEAAVCRNPSIALQKRSRRCSEPFVLDSLTLQNNKWNRKQSTANRGLGKRRLSTTAVLPTSSKHKLQALAKDELLASLNVPLTGQEVASVSSPEEVPCDITDEQIVIEESENKKQAEKDRRETKRLLIMEEILETEKNYISCLETLNAVFRSQLEGTNIISEKDLNSLFPSHLYHIKEAHMLFMTELEERMNNNDYKGIIGDIFARMTSASVNLLEIYTAYVNAFPKSISTLSKCTRSSNKFRKFLEDCYENPMVERLDLPSFLLSPVQRLPRYILLLRELLKYTDDEHPDKYFISGAMNEMELLISSLNSSIHNSMEFFSASDSRRKKMSRQLSSKKRKQRTSSTILRNSKNAKPIPENKSDNDQGYCSLGERKDESPEEETPRRKPRASAWRGKRSMSMISASSEEGKPNNLMIKGGKNDFFISNRNSDTRKSWRRSIGAVFSNLWSNRDDECQNNTSNASSQNNTPTRKSNRTSFENNETIDIEITEVEEEETSSSPLNESTTSNTNELSVAVPARKWSNQSRRKVAIVHTSPSFDGETVISPTVGVLDGNENIENINELVENTSIDDTDGPRPRSLIRTSISSSKPCNLIDSEMSSSSLKEPQSPQNLCRDGKLRRSAGPTKSFFQRSSARMQKTLSMDELNIKKYEHAEEKRKRFSAMSLNKQRSKEQLNKSNSGISSQLSTDEYTIIKSISATDTHSSSSTETISSKTSSAHSSLRDDGDQVHENNNTINGKSKEKKNKLLKTFKSFVGKK